MGGAAGSRRPPPAGPSNRDQNLDAPVPARRSTSGRSVRSRGVDLRRYIRSVPKYAVTLVHAHNWDTKRSIREQERWAEHAAFMHGLVEDGFILVGGPLGSGERTLHLVDAPGEHAVRSRLRGDPWAQMGLLEVGSIDEWTLWLDGRITAR